MINSKVIMYLSKYCNMETYQNLPLGLAIGGIPALDILDLNALAFCCIESG
jgi:hypothetical protein